MLVNYSRTQKGDFYRGGFTVVELLLVIITAGIIATAALPTFMDFKNEARVASATQAANALKSGLAIKKQQMMLRCGLLGTTDVSLAAINANDVTVGGQCTTAQLSPEERKILDSNGGLDLPDYLGNGRTLVVACECADANNPACFPDNESYCLWQGDIRLNPQAELILARMVAVDTSGDTTTGGTDTTGTTVTGGDDGEDGGDAEDPNCSLSGGVWSGGTCDCTSAYGLPTWDGTACVCNVNPSPVWVNDTLHCERAVIEPWCAPGSMQIVANSECTYEIAGCGDSNGDTYDDCNGGRLVIDCAPGHHYHVYLELCIIICDCELDPVAESSCYNMINNNSESTQEFRTNHCATSGCTDSAATNFNPSATSDDGSCMYSHTLSGVSCSDNGQNWSLGGTCTPVDSSEGALYCDSSGNFGGPFNGPGGTRTVNFGSASVQVECTDLGDGWEE